MQGRGLHKTNAVAWRWIALPLALLLTSGVALANTPKVASRAYLNGVLTPVYFNDGDSFEVLEGKHKGMRARLSGFNTLESYGPVHRWGKWHPKELETNAKMATMNARRGVWRCESDLSKDTYGRALWFCLDLAVDQVRKGLAHAMTVTSEPAHPEVVAAQREAIAARRGMWAHGVPAYVKTSAHSYAEARRGRKAYNRMVSTRDGRSASLEHTERYRTCEWACSKERKVSDALIASTARALRARGEVAAEVKRHATHIDRIAEEFAYLGYFAGIEPEEDAAALLQALRAVEAEGPLAGIEYEEGSCVLFVPFESRFGMGQAACLR